LPHRPPHFRSTTAAVCSHSQRSATDPHRSPPAASDQSTTPTPSVNNPPLFPPRLLPAVNCPLPAAYCPLPTANRLLRGPKSRLEIPPAIGSTTKPFTTKPSFPKLQTAAAKCPSHPVVSVSPCLSGQKSAHSSPSPARGFAPRAPSPDNFSLKKHTTQPMPRKQLPPIENHYNTYAPSKGRCNSPWCKTPENKKYFCFSEKVECPLFKPHFSNPAERIAGNTTNRGQETSPASPCPRVRFKKCTEQLIHGS